MTLVQHCIMYLLDDRPSLPAGSWAFYGPLSGVNVLLEKESVYLVYDSIAKQVRALPPSLTRGKLELIANSLPSDEFSIIFRELLSDYVESS